MKKFGKMKFAAVLFVILLHESISLPITSDDISGCYKIDKDGARFQFFCSKTQDLSNETCADSTLSRAMQASDSSAITQLKISGCKVKTIGLAVEEFKKVTEVDISYLYFGLDNSSDLSWFDGYYPIDKKTKFEHSISISRISSDSILSESYVLAYKTMNNLWISNHYTPSPAKLPKNLKTLHLENANLTIERFPCADSSEEWIQTIDVYVSVQSIQQFDTTCINDPIELVTDSNEFVATKNGKFEVHATHESFSKLKTISARSDQLNDLKEIVSLETITLRGRSNQWTDLDFLDLREFAGLKTLEMWDINLKSVKNPSALQSMNLTRLNARGNRIENAREIIEHLSSSIEYLDLSESPVGELNADLFKNLTNLKRLGLRGTNMTIIDSNPFDQLRKLERLEISSNDLSKMEVPIFSSTMEHLELFFATDCRIKNIRDVINSFGPSIKAVELSGNFIGELTAALFEGMKELRGLLIRNTNLTIDNSNPFEALQQLTVLDVSHNDFSNVNLTILSPTLQRLNAFSAANCQIGNAIDALALFGENIILIDVHKNELSEIHNLKKQHFPQLRWLDISGNRFSREYLARLRNEWPELRITDGDSKETRGINVKILEIPI